MSLLRLEFIAESTNITNRTNVVWPEQHGAGLADWRAPQRPSQAWTGASTSVCFNLDSGSVSRIFGLPIDK